MLYKCDECGARIATPVLIDKIDDLRRSELISRENYKVVRELVKQEEPKPYIRCHVSGCQGLLVGL